MIGRYVTVAARIRHDLEDLTRVIDRTERARAAAQRRPEDRDLLFDSIALNLHDFYAGLERIFRIIADQIDGSAPTGAEWHRDLLRQMETELPAVRPRVVSEAAASRIDEYLRFRHVVRNVYAFEFGPPRWFGPRFASNFRTGTGRA